MRNSQQFEHEGVQGFKFGYNPIGQPKLYAHLYFVDGLLIDTGQQKMHHSILKHTGQLAVEQIMITHYHEDHTGNVDHLQRHFDCPAYASPACCEIMKSPPKISLAQQLTWGDRPAYPHLSPITDQVSTPNHRFQIIPAPGHAPDMVVLYEPERRWLFSADLYVNHYIGYMLPEESIQQQIDSIRRVLELDFDVLFCGHNPQFQDGKKMLAKKLAFLEGFFESVADLHQKGLEAKQIFQGLGLKENFTTKLFSGGHLSKMNMVRSVIRDLN